MGNFLTEASQRRVTDEGDVSPKTNTEDLSPNTSTEDVSPNLWTNWAKAIEKSVEMCLLEGDRENAHYSPRYADWLIDHAEWLPLWSSIKRDEFGYGRIPATSASVESDFNHLKNRVLSDVTLPIRTDDFLQKHLKYLRGNMNIVNASKNVNNNCQVEKSLDITESSKDSISSDAQETNCPICAKGQYPSTAHFCVVCRKTVHLISQCSVPVRGEEEGYGQKRVCHGCQQLDHKALQSLISSQEEENWRGLGQIRSKSRYLKRDFVQNEFIVDDKLTTLPIMKNGNTTELKAVRIKNKSISLTNTCGFDSVFQLSLCALQDSEAVRKYAEDSDNDFLNLVKNVQVKGLGQNSYRLRAEILSKIFEGRQRPYDVIEVDCQVTAGTICMRLFESAPSFEEVSKCSLQNCRPRRTSLPVVSIFDSCITDNGLFHLALEETIILKGLRHCPNQNCKGFQESTISSIGKFMN